VKLPAPRAHFVRVRAISAGELKEELSARGLDTRGKKAELVGKLREALENPPAAPDAPANACGRRVDRAVPGGAQYAVYEDYDVKLSESSLVDGANVNKYYLMQVLQKQGGTFATYFKYGKIGETEYGDKLDGPFESAAEAIQSFEAKFHEKTRGKKDRSPKEAAWAAYKAGQFEKREGFYGIVEIHELDGLGSLNKAGKTSIEAWHKPHKPKPGTSPAPPVASPVASSDMEASAAQTQRPAHADYLHYFPEWDGKDAERLEGEPSASVLQLPHGVELRSSSRSRGGPLRADMFRVELIPSDHPLAMGASSEVVHIKVVHTAAAAAGTAAGPSTHGDVPSPLLLRMRHRASAEQFGQLAFYRAETPDSEMHLVEGGCFWSDGYAEVEVTSFSVWKIAPLLGRLVDWVASTRPNSSTRTYVDRPMGVAAFAPTDPKATRFLRFVLHPAQETLADNHYASCSKVGDDKEVTVVRGQVVTIALKDRPELCVTFDPWDNTRQSQTLELGPSSSHSPRIAVISQPGVRQRHLHLLGLSEVQAIMALPDTWKTEAGADVEEPRLVEVPSLVGAEPNLEFEHVASLLAKGLPGASILGLKRVQNARLWEKYAWERHGVARKNGGQSNERELWHSTGHTPANDVCMSEIGFDPTYSIGTALRASLRGSGTDGNKYGIGVYFAEHALYSDVMRPSEAKEGGKEIVLAKVVLGNVKEFGDKLAPDLLREPIDERTGIAYDSWTGTENNLIGVTEIEAVRLSGSPSARRAQLLVDEGHKYGRQYIVCRYQKAYPAYVVRYEVLQDAEL